MKKIRIILNLKREEELFKRGCKTKTGRGRGGHRRKEGAAPNRDFKFRAQFVTTQQGTIVPHADIGVKFEI